MKDPETAGDDLWEFVSWLVEQSEKGGTAEPHALSPPSTSLTSSTPETSSTEKSSSVHRSCTAESLGELLNRAATADLDVAETQASLDLEDFDKHCPPKTTNKKNDDEKTTKKDDEKTTKKDGDKDETTPKKKKKRDKAQTTKKDGDKDETTPKKKKKRDKATHSRRMRFYRSLTSSFLSFCKKIFYICTWHVDSACLLHLWS